jgi:hypothetical protein
MGVFSRMIQGLVGMRGQAIVSGRTVRGQLNTPVLLRAVSRLQADA